MRKAVICSLVAAVAAGGLLGCTATRELQQASSALKQAEEAGAKDKAAYSYYLGQEYLGLAEEENFENDAEAAGRYAQESMGYSEQALRQARGGAQ